MSHPSPSPNTVTAAAVTAAPPARRSPGLPQSRPVARLLLLAALCAAVTAVAVAADCPALSWESRQGAEVDQQPLTMALDPDGNVYVTGLRIGTGYHTVKYAPTGTRLWEHLYQSGGGSPRSLAVDGSGNVYITGVTRNPDTADQDATTLKYDTEGNLEWARVLDTPGPSAGADVAVDAGGNVVVVGASSANPAGDLNSYDFLVVKYDAAGTELWRRSYAGPAGRFDLATAVTTDAGNNIYVTGDTRTETADTDVTTLKYDAAGALLWAQRYGGAGQVNDQAIELAADPTGGVFVGGNTATRESGADYLAVRYAADGTERWVRRTTGPGTGRDGVAALAVDPQGNLVLTGTSVGVDTRQDYLTVKYGAEGALLWSRRYDGPSSGIDVSKSLAVGSDGNVYVTGSSDDLRLGERTPTKAVATISYGPLGEFLWARRYNNRETATDVGAAVAVDAAGDVYVFGSSSASRLEYLTLKYTPSTEAPLLEEVQLAAEQVSGGRPLRGRVVLACPAPAGGAAVQLTVSSSRARVPAVVTVPAGAISVDFNIRTRPGRDTVPAELTAHHEGRQATAQFVVRGWLRPRRRN